MKIFVNGENFSTYQVDKTWAQTEDEIVLTEIGFQRKSKLKSKEFLEKLKKKQQGF